jgi:HK97 family phage major capsid protein
MPNVTTAQLFSIETVNQLVVEPCWTRSACLPYLQRLDTRSTSYYLPTVAGGTAAWVPEMGDIPDAGVTAAELEVTPKKVAALQACSTESVQDSNAANIIGRALTDSITRAIDAAVVNGAGPNGPLGLPGVVGSSSVDGPTNVLESYVDAIEKIETAGGTPTVVFVSPVDWASLQKLQSGAGSNVPALSPSTGANGEIVRSLYGVKVSVVSALATGTAWVVDGTRTVVVQRTPATVAANPGPLFTKDAVLVRCTMRVETASCYPATVCKIFDTTPLAAKSK